MWGGQFEELGAGSLETGRSLCVAKTIDGFAFLADDGRKSREVAVAGNNANAFAGAAVEELHGVNDQGDVSDVFVRNVADLRAGDKAEGPLHGGPTSIPRKAADHAVGTPDDGRA